MRKITIPAHRGLRGGPPPSASCLPAPSPGGPLTRIAAILAIAGALAACGGNTNTGSGGVDPDAAGPLDANGSEVIGAGGDVGGSGVGDLDAAGTGDSDGSVPPIIGKDSDQSGDGEAGDDADDAQDEQPCVTHEDCPPGQACTTQGWCRPAGTFGTPCASNVDCFSGFCVPGPAGDDVCT